MPRYNSPRKTWKYSKKFKVGAVLYSFEEGVKNQQVSDALGIHPYMLSRWRREYLEGKLRIQGPRVLSVSNKESLKINKRELKESIRLKKENEQLRMENDLLKKWQRYLAEQHQNDLDLLKDTES